MPGKLISRYSRLAMLSQGLPRPPKNNSWAPKVSQDSEDFLFSFFCSAFHLDHLDHCEAFTNQAPKAKKMHLVLIRAETGIAAFALDKPVLPELEDTWIHLDIVDNLDILEYRRRNRRI